MREAIERIAREKATEIVKGYIQPDDHYPPRYNLDDIIGEVATKIADTILSALRDPDVGFKEAWELAHRNRFLCQNCRRSLWDRACPEYCPCPCHTAEAKLKELEELK